ncbi:MAG: hypothetical protein JO247_06380 [Chloroflexi bacterium]|nr:hypothetical protein [Chloroflexota bacterium]
MKVEKVTISLPGDVFAWGEAERAKMQLSRSEFVTRLYRDRMYQQELDERARQYERAFKAHPYTEEENQWTRMSSEMLFQGWEEDDAALAKDHHGPKKAKETRRSKRGARRNLVDALPATTDA